MAEATQTLSCRLPATLAGAVEDRRRTLGKESVSEYLKALIMADLARAGEVPEARPASPPDLEPVMGELHLLREDVATIAVALVVTLGKQSRGDAEAWVRKCLSSSHPLARGQIDRSRPFPEQGLE